VVQDHLWKIPSSLDELKGNWYGLIESEIVAVIIICPFVFNKILNHVYGV
jgi:hypothetical protein